MMLSTVSIDGAAGRCSAASQGAPTTIKARNVKVRRMVCTLSGATGSSAAPAGFGLQPFPRYGTHASRNRETRPLVYPSLDHRRAQPALEKPMFYVSRLI